MYGGENLISSVAYLRVNGYINSQTRKAAMFYTIQKRENWLEIVKY